ncbi:MAG: methionyl-tRNA formyltransferase [Bacteroidales bacterium]|jgi:methionyl-tRNA formyltransferase|nr:methionyl-tRNA formyltransferase [Bacteroidales bacterium]
MLGKDLRIVFMGTPDFAVASLKTLVEKGYNIVGVVTAPDKPAGRGKLLSESAVKKYAVKNNLLVLQPEKLKNKEFIDGLTSLQADLQIVVAFRMLPEIVWVMPRLGTFNLHGSLLPQYRGAAPLNWVIINGETKTGVTTFLLDHEIDTGKILFKQEIKIDDNYTVENIHNKLMEIGANLVVKTIDAIAGGNIKPVPQQELTTCHELKHAPKIFKENCKIDWSRSTESIRNLIRGLSPYPAAWTVIINNETRAEIQVKIFFAMKNNYTKDLTPPGTIESDGKTFLNIACGDGWLQITDLQLAGKKRMKTDEFLRGFQQINSCSFK